MRTRLSAIAATVLTLGCWTLAQTPGDSKAIREPAVAGQFYPAQPAALKQALEAYLRDAVPPKPDRPIAIVVPHAGYIYSAQIAADAWRQAGAHRYDTIVILGTNHTGAATGRVSVYSGSGFRTPLGTVGIDKAIVDALVREDPISVLDQAAHAREHSVEVHVPFVQHLFPHAKIVAAIVGTEDPAACARFGRALGKILKDRQALIVASSDLSHYPSARDAPGVDRRTLEAIASLSPDRLRSSTEMQMQRGVPELVTTACGEAPIMAAMAAATLLGATRGTVVSYANSADVAVGDPARAVGYGAVVFTSGERGSDTSALVPPPVASKDAPLTPADKKALLQLARETLRRYLNTETLPLARGLDPKLQRNQGVFVTLRKRGDLRGCIGNITGGAPLCQLVSRMALEAALNDPRFSKVQPKELDSLEIEISVLTPLKSIGRPQEIVVGRDGVILSKSGRSAVFLPQVATEQGWGLEEMLDNLCLKAGLPTGAWRSGASFSVFQAEVFGEGEFKKQE
jgi:AmmeMemoRadiSam system protein B/AmmeMemoRadiSam system protein A